jgi:DNA-binding transcriptional MerR regulator
MKESMKQQMAEAIKSFHMPRYDELPNEGLYLEQTTQYINHVFAPLGCMTITSSMISNYVKKGIIAPPIKKLYYAEQIAYLFYIAIAKNVLSLEHIVALREMQEKSYPKEIAYDYLCEELENVLFHVFGLKDRIDDIGRTKSDEKMLFREVIIAASNSIHLTSCFNALQMDK